MKVVINSFSENISTTNEVLMRTAYVIQIINVELLSNAIQLQKTHKSVNKMHVM